MSKSHSKTLSSLINRCLLVFYLVFGLPASVAVAGPEGAQVVNGQVSFQQSGLNTAITASDKAIINYSKFDITQPEIVQFIQPSSSASVLNRILSANPTNIDGTLLANGRVFFVNPAGVYIGSGARINVNQLIASALNITNADFINGQYNFAGGNGSAINRGDITAEKVYLVGKQVANSGSISCPDGFVVMASGDRVFLGEPGSDVMVEVDPPAVPEAAKIEGSAVLNEGTVEVESGSIILAAAGDIYSQAISNVGTLSASAPTGDAGSVKLAAADGTVINDGTIEASGNNGGQVTMEGVRVGQFGTIHADGTEGNGGEIDLWASDVVALSSDSLTTANAGLNSDGGDVTVFSPDTALFWPNAKIEAKGGQLSGNGGFVEVSGWEHVEIYGDVDAGAANGKAGLFFIDPDNNVDIAAADLNGGWDSGDPTNTFAPNNDDSTVNNATIKTNLETTNVTITTVGTGVGGQAGNITMTNGIDLGGTAADKTLTLTAKNDIAISQQITNSGGNGVNLVLQSDHDGDGTGNITTTASITTGGGNVTMNAGDGGDGGDTNVITISEAIATNGGDIILNAADGVTLDNANSDITTGAGTYTVDADTDNDGTGTYGHTNASATVITTDTAISVTAADFNFTGTMAAGNGAIGLISSVDSRTIGIGDATTNIQLTNAELDNLTTTDTITIGATSQTGDITIGTSEVLNQSDKNFEFITTGTLTTQTNAFTTTGDVSFTANSMAIGSAVDTAANVTLRPVTTGRTIGVSDGTGDLSLDDAELDLFTNMTGTLTIGRSTAGNIYIGSALPLTQDKPLTFDNDGATYNTYLRDNITTTGAKTITFNDPVIIGDGLSITLSTGAAIAGNIAFGGTLNSTAGGGAENLTVISGTGTTTFTGAVGGGAPLGTIALQSNDGTENGAVTFNGNVTADTVTTYGQGYAVAFNEDATITNAVTFANTGALTLGDAAGDILLFNGGLTATAPSGVTLNGQIRSSDDLITIGDAGTGVTLAGGLSIIDTVTAGTTGGGITVNGAVSGAADNTQSLTLVAGSAGVISFGSTIGATAATQPATLTVTSSNGATFTGAVTTDTSVVLTDTEDGSDIEFTGALITPTLTTAAQGYDLELFGSGTIITNAVDFTNTGALTLGNAAADTLLFNGGLTATAPSGVTLNGQVRSSGDLITIGDAGTGVTLAGTTSIIDTTNNGGTATGGAIAIDGAVEGTVANTQSLTLTAGTAGTIAASSTIGAVTTPATLTVTSSNGATFTGAVTTDTSVVLTDTEDGSDIEFTGALITPTLTTAAQGYDLELFGSGTIITNAVDFTNTGALTLGNAAADTLLFNGGLTATAPSGVTLNGQVRSSGDLITIGDAGTGVTLAGTTSIIDTTNNGGTAAGGAIAIDGAVNGTADNTQSLTLVAGSAGTIAFSSTIGATADKQPATLTVTSSNGATFTGAVTTDTSVVLTDTENDADIEFTGALITPLLTTAAQGYDLELFGSGTIITAAVDFTNTGALTLGNAAGDILLFNGGLTATAPSGVNIAGTVATTDTQMDLGATTMTAASTLKSGTGAINVASMGGDFDLTLQSDVAGATGAVTFAGNVVANDLITFAQNYAVTLQGAASVIDSDTSFLNTGLTTIGNGAADSSTFTGGLDATSAGGVSIAGTVATTDTQMDLGATTITANSALSTGAGGGNITFQSTLNGTTALTENLTLTAGTGDIAFSDIVGGNTALGNVTVNSATNVTISKAFNANDIKITASDSTIDIDDDVTATVDIELNNNTTVADGKTLTAGNDLKMGAGKTLTGEGDLTLVATSGGITEKTGDDGKVQINMAADDKTLTLTQSDNLDMDSFVVTNDEDTALDATSTGGTITSTAAGSWKSIAANASGNLTLTNLGNNDAINIGNLTSGGEVWVQSIADLTTPATATITANGTYDATVNDDRSRVQLKSTGADSGDPIDVAIYLGSYDFTTMTGGNVTVDSIVNMNDNGTMVIDAYDTVNAFGSNFTGSAPWSNATNRLEVVSRTTLTLGDAINNKTLPHAREAGGNMAPSWFNGEKYVLRGKDLVLAEVLAMVGSVPLAPAVFMEPEGFVEIEREDPVSQVEEKFGEGFLQRYHPDASPEMLAADYSLVKIAEHILELDQALEENKADAIEILNKLVETLPLPEPGNIGEIDKALAKNNIAAEWINTALDFVLTVNVVLGHPADYAVQVFMDTYLSTSNASSQTTRFIRRYLQIKLESTTRGMMARTSDINMARS